MHSPSYDASRPVHASCIQPALKPNYRIRCTSSFFTGNKLTKGLVLLGGETGGVLLIHLLSLSLALYSRNLRQRKPSIVSEDMSPGLSPPPRYSVALRPEPPCRQPLLFRHRCSNRYPCHCSKMSIQVQSTCILSSGMPDPEASTAPIGFDRMLRKLLVQLAQLSLDWGYLMKGLPRTFHIN